ncbi:MAG: MBL fold metallo-hydrolase, partial [Erysipelotrichaceae bacterium]|nr:MBL fold metallo-hydrolase [Erysipelotrichaceae bacterium]
ATGSETSASMSDLSCNILYVSDSYSTFAVFPPRYLVYKRLHSFNEETNSILDRYLYDVYPSQDLRFSLGYGYLIYGFIRKLRKKSNSLCVFFIILFSILFRSDIRFTFILIGIIGKRLDLSKENILAVKMICICLFNFTIYQNVSVELILLLEVFEIFEFSIDFGTYMMLVESFLFGEIDLIYSFLFYLIDSTRTILVLLITVLFLFPATEPLFLRFLSLFSFLYETNLSVRGKISIISFFLFIIALKLFPNDSGLYKKAILLLCILSPLNHPFMHVSFIDVGQGDASLIRDSLYRTSILIDTGSSYQYYSLKKALFNEGIYSIDYLIITHDDEDHNGNIENLKKDFRIENIIQTGTDIGLRRVYLKYFELHDADNDNDSSLVYALNVDHTAFLFTGDISADTEKELLHRYGPLDIDVLKVAHHGSYTSSSRYFISSILPRFAVISTSGRYGHPHDSVLSVLNDYKVKYYITRDDGTVTFSFSRFLDFITTGKGEFVIMS